MASVFQNPEEKLWYVIKHYHGVAQQQARNSNRNGIRLEKNDIVKFGRVRLRVRDIDYGEKEPAPMEMPSKQRATALEGNANDGGSQVHLDDIEMGFATGRHIADREAVDVDENPIVTVKARVSSKGGLSQSSSQLQCRICWGGEEEDDSGEFNPLISPCNCTGSISSIHLKCLKGWLETKRSFKLHKDSVVIKFKKLDCELCKQVFPFQIAHNNRIVDIVSIDKPAKDFIVFESISSATVPQKVFYIVNTEGKQHIRVGRAQESDVRITDDISVSRCHATIRKTNRGDYILEDYNSKFGTLVQV